MISARFEIQQRFRVDDWDFDLFRLKDRFRDWKSQLNEQKMQLNDQKSQFSISKKSIYIEKVDQFWSISIIFWYK